MAENTAQGASQSGGGSIIDLLQAFLRVQEQRSGHYARFNAAFKRYLVDRDAPAFQVCVKETTGAFGSCSTEVRGLEAALGEGACGRPDLASLLRSIQVRILLFWLRMFFPLQQSSSDFTFLQTIWNSVSGYLFLNRDVHLCIVRSTSERNCG